MNSAESAEATGSAQHALDKNDPREIFGWKMYDWANSAFYTTVVSTLYGPYLTELTQRVVGENGVIASFGPAGSITPASSPWSTTPPR